MIVTTEFFEYVEVEFLIDDPWIGVKTGQKLLAKCQRQKFNTDQYQVFTYKPNDPSFFITGTAEEIQKQIKFLEKKTIKTR